MKRVMALAITLTLCAFAAQAQQSTATATAKTTKRKSVLKTDPAVAAQLNELKQAVDAQQQQIRQLSDQVQSRDQQIQQLQQRLDESQAVATQAQSKADNAAAQSAEQQQTVTALKNDVADLKTINTNAALSIQETQKTISGLESPLAIHYKGVTLTPGGFMDLTSIFRTTNVGSGIGTSFGSIPFNNTFPQAALTESRFSAQNSRLSLKANGKFGETDVTAYVESDFLGFQPPNANQTSNSDSFRLRLYFADLKRHKLEVQGGQMWTWMTPNRVGLSPMPSDIFYTQNMDTNYQVGLTWARQTAFRVAYHPTNWWAFGVSIENPEQFVPSSVALPNSTFTSQFDNGSGSTSASSSGTNPATPNLHPDIIVKTAFDWKLGGKAMHVEAAGLGRSFKVYNNLVTPGTTNTITGGGGSVNVNLELIKNLHVIGNSFYSCGGGRYIFGLGPDVIVKSDGKLSCVHSGSGIGGLEWQTAPKFMVYSYYGGAYYQRNFDFIPVGSGSTPNGTPCPAAAPPAGFNCVGFGFLGSSTSANRAIQEGTIGFIPTLWTSPKYGKLQLITQYSYLTRAPWYVNVASASPKNAHTSLVYVDLRYALP